MLSGRIAIPLLSCLLATVSSASAQEAEEFYRNKQVNFIVSSDVGGGFDTYARLIARRMPSHMPGKPTIVVQNMPGAGGTRAANFIYSIAPKDGTTIGMVQNTVPLESLYGNKQATFDAKKFSWLGSPNEEVAVLLVWHSVPVDRIADAKKHQLVIGASGANSSSAFYARIFEEVFGTKMKVIPGYRGASDAMLGMERGENDGNTSAYWSSLKATKPDWIRDKKIKLILQYGARPHPDLPNVPFAYDLISDSKKREIMMVASAPLGFGRPMMAPPNVPADRILALRAALTATFKDKDYLAECNSLQLDCDTAATGEVITERIERVFSATPEINALIRDLYGAGSK